ncbi:MAG: methylated-DNA--[protein]-cysteine S-methyltransferase [Desulfovibrio sp.]|jgi:methylated-DNA-[protein]-cysteine S-methyltransferase|nr:methylated-DNA--[protein]-cysteine S-methyltransferase [Desulfovibrio sp.]
MIFRTCFSSPIGQICLEADDEALLKLELPSENKRETLAGKHLRGQAQDRYCDVLAEARAQVRAWLQGKLRSFTLPVAPGGTIFQKAVWREICAIDYGRTRTYGEIAACLGNSRGTRAVGGAAHANPLPLIIPCHRVVGAGGALTGFAAGIAVKQALLALEHSF